MPSFHLDMPSRDWAELAARDRAAKGGTPRKVEPFPQPAACTIRETAKQPEPAAQGGWLRGIAR